VASALTALANVTLGATASTITFSSISGSYRDLILVGNMTAATTGYIGIYVNGDGGANYVWIQMYGNGSSLSSSSSTSASSVGLNNGSTTSTTDPLLFKSEFLDYSATNKHKTVLTRVGRSGGSTEMTVARWANTSAITSLQVYGAGGANFAAGSTFALYGVSS
jgi:hypothetical protein